MYTLVISLLWKKKNLVLMFYKSLKLESALKFIKNVHYRDIKTHDYILYIYIYDHLFMCICLI